MQKVAIIGYSGHAYVVIEAALASGIQIIGYYNRQEDEVNPYNLPFLGSERASLIGLMGNQWFVSIGDNQTRRSVYEFVIGNIITIPPSIIHPTAFISKSCSLGNGSFIGTNVIIHPMVTIGNGVICNSGCIVEHECTIGDFCHISPGAVLCGNVKVGENSWIGANSVVKQGIQIGKDVVIGAGSVVLRDVLDGTTMVGNPAKPLQRKR